MTATITNRPLTTSNKSSRIFDLPELVKHIALHLPQASLFQCVQVSKSWHETFIRHLWRTFVDHMAMKPSSRLPIWDNNLIMAITSRRTDPQEYEWYMDVFRRHARYIRHLTINQPIILDACLEDAFGSSSSPTSSRTPNDDHDDKDTEESLMSGTTTAAPTTARSIVAGQSLLTELESLTVNVTRHSLVTCFPEAFAMTQHQSSTTSLFGSTATFSFGAFQNNINNNIVTNISNEITTDLAATTTQSIPNEDPEKPFIDACQRLVLCNPKLRTLQCGQFPKILENLLAHPTSQKALLSLKSLSIMFPCSRIPALLPLNITNLAMNCMNNTLASLPSNNDNNDSNSPPNPVHEGLEILNVTNVESGSHLRILLTQAPSLKTLFMSSTIAQPGFGLRAVNIPHPTTPWPLSRITVLKCHQSRGLFSLASNFEGVYQAFPQLVEYHDDLWCPVVPTQLSQHCPLLEVVCIREDPISSNRTWSSYQPGFSRRLEPLRLGDRLDDIASVLLSSLPRLRVLDIPFEVIQTENILETPWVCLDLEELSCRLVGVPYLTQEQEEHIQGIHNRDAQQPRTVEEERLVELNDRCDSTRRSIMSQLSKMTSLKSLSLSPDLKIRDELFENRVGGTLVYKSERDGRNYIRYNDVLPDTLHLRLGSGLEQLASLKQLEYLGFESMDHRMDTAEIEWMAQQFPKLKEMRGLSTESYIGMEPDPKNDALVALMRRLRPDVVQGQSFSGYTTIGTWFGVSVFGTSSGSVFR